jgi:hypothetical protein
MLTCNAFATNTVGTTQQTAACVGPKVANLSDHQLLDEQALLLILDSIERIRMLYSPAAPLADVAACDAADAIRNASCVMLTNTPAFGSTPAQLQALIFHQLNEILCQAN